MDFEFLVGGGMRETTRLCGPRSPLGPPPPNNSVACPYSASDAPTGRVVSAASSSALNSDDVQCRRTSPAVEATRATDTRRPVPPRRLGSTTRCVTARVARSKTTLVRCPATTAPYPTRHPSAALETNRGTTPDMACGLSSGSIESPAWRGFFVWSVGRGLVGGGGGPEEARELARAGDDGDVMWLAARAHQAVDFVEPLLRAV